MKDNYGCKNGLPHDLKIIYENKSVKWEVCMICNRKFRWNKGYKERINSSEYLKVHIRNFAQKFGTTKRLYYKIYQPEKLKIII